MDVGKLTWTMLYEYYINKVLEYLDHFGALDRFIVAYVLIAVYYCKEDFHFQGRFNLRNIGLEFTWTELGLGLLTECVLLVLYCIAGGFLCCLLIGLVLVVFIGVNYIKAKTASQNETLSSDDRIANQGENTGPNTSQRSTTEAGNEVMLTSQNEAHTSEDRSASQKESPDQSIPRRRSRNGRKIHHTVLNRCVTKLLQDLDFKAVYPHIVENSLFDEFTRRDIEEQNTSNAKKQYLIDRLKERDAETYEKFKDCLVSSKQEHLKTMLEEKENEVSLEME